MKTCPESFLRMIITSTEKILEHFKHVHLMLNSIWVRLALKSTIRVYDGGRSSTDASVEQLKDATKVDDRNQQSLWENFEANALSAERHWVRLYGFP
ncbi:hypothetical protein R1flu_011465 [Riccia fluitans]|uniref:Uncharacterized protein n=1 Tax=Riccia fluitans TaxID=41844 RepID=A0ABD1Z8Z8_9MARC